MKSITIAILGDPLLGSMLAKKGTESDIRFYNSKRKDIALTCVEPFRYPEKLQSLAFALSMADAVILTIDKIDQLLGEQIIAIDSFGIDHGFIILRNYIQIDQIRPLIAGTVLERYAYIDPEIHKVNDALPGISPKASEGGFKIPVDHFYNVKGVGTVALGCVRRGEISQHDEVELFPKGKRGIVRSIQVLDEDTPKAVLGDRVGIALKGIDIEDVERGCVLAPPGALSSGQNVHVRAIFSKYWKGSIEVGRLLYAEVGLQFVSCRIFSVAGDPGSMFQRNITLQFDSPIAYETGERIVLMDIDSKGPRVIGHSIIT